MPRLINGYSIKHQNDLNWLLIFHHVSNGSIFFHKNDDASRNIEKKRFSILGYVNTSDFKVVNEKRDSVYEFLIEYPEITGYNQWQQSLFPNDQRTLTQNIDYVPKHISWSRHFSGLILFYDQTNPQSYIDGTIGTNWHFAIGAYESYYSDDAFPGPCLIAATPCKESYHEVNLWMRIDNFALLKKLKLIFTPVLTCRKNFHFTYSFFITTLFLE